MRCACLLVEHLPTRVEVLLDPGLASQPLALLRAWDERVLDASPDVETVGVGAGDSRRRVEQLYPEAVIRIAREAVYQSYHDTLKAVLACFTDAVETWDLGAFFIEVSALARTFPSEKALALHLAAQAQHSTQLLPTIGVASNKFTAMQAARQAGSEPSRAFVVPEGGERRFLSPLRLTVLPNPPVELLRRLHLFGITTLGGLAQLPRPAVTMQFGTDMGIFYDLARGIDPRPLTPQSPPLMVIRTRTLPDPLSDRRRVLVEMDYLAEQIALELDVSGHHAMGLCLTVLTADGQEETIGTSIRPPSADADLLRRLGGRLLGRLQLAAGVSELGLTAYPLREWHLCARQLTLFEEPVQPKLARLRKVVRTLQQRFGEAVIRLASVVGPPLPLPVQVHLHPDGMPARLCWDGWSRRVESVYETWREYRNWWDDPVVRSYYLVETDAETAFTVFRDGQGRWFLDRRRE